MAYIDQNLPPSPNALHRCPDDYLVGALAGATRWKSRVFFVHRHDIGRRRLGQPLQFAAYVGIGKRRAPKWLADTAQRGALARYLDDQCRAHWKADRQGWGVPV